MCQNNEEGNDPWNRGFYSKLQQHGPAKKSWWEQAWSRTSCARLEPVKILLTEAQTENKPFSVFSAASESDMKELWLELEQIDQSLLFNEKHRKKDLPNFPQLVQFLSHCYQVRHYSFTIKKCFVMITMQTCVNVTRSFWCSLISTWSCPRRGGLLPPIRRCLWNTNFRRVQAKLANIQE